MEPLLLTNDLCKRYPGVIALNKMNISVEKGRMVGLLGPNGSGKSTFLRIAAAQSAPTSGSIYIKGLRPGLITKSLVSYSPDSNFLYSWMTIKEAVNFYAVFFPGFNREKTEELLDFMSLQPQKHIDSLSKGMLSRLKLVLALSWAAELVLLDEPLFGIDPASRDKIVEGVLRGNSAGDKTVIIATHLVNEIEPILSHVIFLQQGSVIHEGEAEELREEYGCSLDQFFRRRLA